MWGKWHANDWIRGFWDFVYFCQQYRRCSSSLIRKKRRVATILYGNRDRCLSGDAFGSSSAHHWLYLLFVSLRWTLRRTYRTLREALRLVQTSLSGGHSHRSSGFNAVRYRLRLCHQRICRTRSRTITREIERHVGRCRFIYEK
uniref:Uncharacterized protein n=1 Tax=Strigamia maritima TaxID=126957 RepID=T1JNI3_STRMM